MEGLVKIEKEMDENSICCSEDKPRYPYGTELCVRDDLVTKLGLDAVQVGDEVQIIAVAKITGTRKSQNETEGEGIDVSKSVDLQLTEVKISGARAPMMERFYGLGS